MLGPLNSRRVTVCTAGVQHYAFHENSELNGEALWGSAAQMGGIVALQLPRIGQHKRVQGVRRFALLPLNAGEERLHPCSAQRIPR